MRRTRAHTVGRCRRSVSPSIRSSCSSEKLWTSSKATAAGTPDLGCAPAACADSTASTGRMRLAAGARGRAGRRVPEAEVVARRAGCPRRAGRRRRAGRARPVRLGSRAVRTPRSAGSSCVMAPAAPGARRPGPGGPSAARRPLRTAPSMVAGHPVAVHAPARSRARAAGVGAGPQRGRAGGRAERRVRFAGDEELHDPRARRRRAAARPARASTYAQRRPPARRPRRPRPTPTPRGTGRAAIHARRPASGRRPTARAMPTPAANGNVDTRRS